MLSKRSHNTAWGKSASDWVPWEDRPYPELVRAYTKMAAFNIDTLAPSHEPFFHHDSLLTTNTAFQVMEDEYEPDAWVAGPDLVFYPPKNLVSDMSAMMSHAIILTPPAPFYMFEHNFNSTMHMHTSPWIPRSLIARRAEFPGGRMPVNNPQAVDYVSHWRLVFEHLYSFGFCNQVGGYWSGHHMDVLFSDVTPTIGMRSQGLQFFLDRIQLELYHLLCLLLGCDADDQVRSPLDHLTHPGSEPCVLALSIHAALPTLTQGIFSMYHTKQEAIAAHSPVCPLCLTETVPFCVNMYGWPHVWWVFMTDITDTVAFGEEDVEECCTLCAMDYLSRLDKLHKETMENIAMLANRCLRSRELIAVSKPKRELRATGSKRFLARAATLDVPEHLRLIPPEIWQLIGQAEKKSACGKVDDRLLKTGTVWKMPPPGHLSYRVEPHPNIESHEEIEFSRRRHKWLRVTRTTANYESLTEPCYHHVAQGAVSYNNVIAD